jgi:hypothetical protein
MIINKLSHVNCPRAGSRGARTLYLATPGGAPCSAGGEGGSDNWEQLEATAGSRRWMRRLGCRSGGGAALAWVEVDRGIGLKTF